MKIAWVSPLPPAASEIANFSARLVGALRSAAEVTFVDPDGGKPGDVNATPLSKLDAQRATAFDLIVYHMGNNATFHGAIYDAACRYPGVVVLHDCVLQDFFWNYRRDARDARGNYLRSVERYYGDGAVDASARFWDVGGEARADVASMPLFEPAIENALGVVVHSRLAFEAVQRVEMCPVVRLELAHPLCRDFSARKARVDDRLELLVFGHLGANRRVREMVQALADSPRRDRIRLRIIGKIADRATIDTQIVAAGLASHVSIEGSVSDAALDAALARADLVLNLRNPTMGEASASQLRIFEHGAASVVSNHGWYGDLPDDVVFKVPPNDESAALIALMDRALDDAASVEAKRRAGFDYVRTVHTAEAYVAGLIEFARRIERAPSAWLARRLSTRAARALAALDQHSVGKSSPIARRAVVAIERLADTGAFEP